jgi:lipopolysaccharide/colanic/teichoic acid biosynthesis glycosyltransferase
MKMATSDSSTRSLYDDTVAPLRPCRSCPSCHAYAGTMAITQGAADFAASALGVLAAIVIAMRIHFAGPVRFSSRESLALSLGAGLVSLLLQHGQRSKGMSASVAKIHATQEAIRIATPTILALVPAGLLLDRRDLLPAFLVALFVVPILLILEKHLLLSIDSGLRSRVCGSYPGILRAAASAVEPVRPTRRDSMSMGIRLVEAPTLKYFHAPAPVLAIPHEPRVKLREVATAEHTSSAKLEGHSGLLPHDSQQSSSVDLAGLMFWDQDHFAAPWGYPIVKRLLDIVLSTMLLFLLAPVLLLIALVISLDSPGPPIFVQRRVGLDGRLFDIYKFRSMHPCVPRYELSPTSSRDPRITRVGRLLRRTSLDELPQLLNVLSGDMSLVGPRPEMPFIVEQYNAFQRQRLQVVPGITGLWQLSADRRSQIHENLHYDLNYIRNRTICLDLAILTHTLFFAMRGI